MLRRSDSRPRELPLNDTLLGVENLKIFFQTVEGLARVVDGVPFEIRNNEIFALVGESGCGKSVTTLSSIQLVPQPSGFIAERRIYCLKQEITSLSEVGKRKIQGVEIAIVFQDPMTSLDLVFTVGNQIVEAFEQH